MTKSSYIRTALFQAARDYLVSVQVDGQPFDEAAIEWPNREIPAGDNPEVWAKVSYLRTPKEPQGIGVGGRDRIAGVMQIDVNVGQGEGDRVLRDFEDAADEFFYAGKKFQYSGQSVTIMQSGVQDARKIDNFFRLTISISFYSDVFRPKG